MESANIDKQVIEKLKELPHFNMLKFIYLFGSAVKGKQNKRSDIDICLYYDIKDKEKLHKLLFKISGSFPDRFDIQIFNLLPLYVQKDVFRGKLIFSKNTDFVHDIARKTYLEYEDFEPRYKHILYGKQGMRSEFEERFGL